MRQMKFQETFENQKQLESVFL